MQRWTVSDMPSQQGCSAIVTGAGGLGFEDALALARASGEVIIAGRNPEKGEHAVKRIREDIPAANVRFELLDLGDLRSIADFGNRLRKQRDSLDLLINNAGVMTPPQRRETSDGFELQIGTNYLGHFALTGHLLPLLKKGNKARVVSLSSLAARDGRIDFEDFQAKGHYKPMSAYSQSKLACLMYAFEFERRSLAQGWGISSIAAHPGISRTELLPNGAGRFSAAGLLRLVAWFLFQPAAQGALPTLYAATSPAAEGGSYYGPDGWNELRGYPGLAVVPDRAKDSVVASRLWDLSEALTGVEYR